MFPRLLWLSGLSALLWASVADFAAARPRRAPQVTVPSAPVAANKAVPAAGAPADNPTWKTVTYPVADLVIPIESSPAKVDTLPKPEPTESHILLQSPFSKKSKVGVPSARCCSTLEDELIQLLINSVARNTWNSHGGRGTMQYYPLGMALVISQTPEVHEEVRHLLNALRRMQDLELAVEVRMVHVEPSLLDKTCMDMALLRKEDGPCKASTSPQVKAPEGMTWTATLDSTQLKSFLEALQSDERTKILAAPRTTTFDGQRAVISATNQQIFLTGLHLDSVDGQVSHTPVHETFSTGLRCGLEGTIAADRRSVRLHFEACSASLAPGNLPAVTVQVGGQERAERFQMRLHQPKFTKVVVDRCADIGDGLTLVIHGGTLPVEVKGSRGGFLARWLGWDDTAVEARSVVFLVTPRIIVNEEAEAEAKLSQLPPIPRP